MANHPDASVAECREFAIMAVRDAVTRYGDAAAEQATALYDDVMEAEGVDVPPALPYDGPDERAIEGTMRRLAGDRPDVGGFLGQVRNLSADKVRAAAGDTMMRNVEPVTKVPKREDGEDGSLVSVTGILKKGGVPYWNSTARTLDNGEPWKFKEVPPSPPTETIARDSCGKAR